MSVRVSCPSCGGPVVFEVGSSVVAVCPYCRSVVARGDRSPEDLGKVAALVDTGAVLRVGLTGKFNGIGFRLTGRVQLAHEAGGLWDEWYAAFDDGRWGWLSEAQGRYDVLFEQPTNAERPQLDRLEPGAEVPLPEAPQRFVVAETGTATAKGAEGEIPYRLVPGSTYRYADLSGEAGGFATLDYSASPPTLYLGKEVSLDDLGLPPNLRRETFELREVAARRINCPNCGGPLELKAPDRTERVGCPYCGSLLDATQGNLKLLDALKKPPFELRIPLGTRGTLGVDERTVIGAIRRSVTSEGTDYPWTEYLLYHPRDGFEWLVESCGHWSRVRGVPAAAVSKGSVSATYDGRGFRKFQSGEAVVRGVIGECYWKVAIGEKAFTVDYLRPPEMLSCERSRAGEEKEVNWSLGTYLTPAEVQAAFGLKDPLPAPEGIAPNQPFPYWGVYKLAAVFIGALCLLGLALLLFFPTRKVHEQTFTLPANEQTTVLHTDPLFDLRGHRNVRVTVSAPELNNNGLVIEGDLVRQENGESQPFVLPLSYHSGVDEGESWSEGSRVATEYLPAHPAGHYSLRLEVERENPGPAETLTVKVEQGAPHFKNWFLTLVGISLIPLGVGVYHVVFVHRRWQNSDPYFGDDDGSPPRRPKRKGRQ
jgi:hypothetical protein